MCFSMLFIQSSDTTSYKTNFTISFCFHSYAQALAVHCVQPRKNTSMSSAKTIYILSELSSCFGEHNGEKGQVLAIKHWVVMYNIPYQREVKQGLDHWHHCIPLKPYQKFTYQSLCTLLRLLETTEHFLLSHLGPLKIFLGLALKNLKWNTITNNITWISDNSAYPSGRPIWGQMCWLPPPDNGPSLSSRNADLEYLSLFTNVYYSEMLDQYRVVHMMVDRRTMLPALNI